MLKVQRLSPDAVLPKASHVGEDLGWDVSSIEDIVLVPGFPTKVRTGIAARFEHPSGRKFGLVVEDRSSMAAAGVFKSAGIIDYGYTGELKIILTATDTAYTIKKGERIAQIMPREIFTDSPVLEVRDLGDTSRGDGGFGSTGR